MVVVVDQLVRVRHRWDLVLPSLVLLERLLRGKFTVTVRALRLLHGVLEYSRS